MSNIVGKRAGSLTSARPQIIAISRAASWRWWLPPRRLDRLAQFLLDAGAKPRGGSDTDRAESVAIRPLGEALTADSGADHLHEDALTMMNPSYSGHQHREARGRYRYE